MAFLLTCADFFQCSKRELQNFKQTVFFLVKLSCKKNCPYLDVWHTRCARSSTWKLWSGESKMESSFVQGLSQSLDPRTVQSDLPHELTGGICNRFFLLFSPCTLWYTVYTIRRMQPVVLFNLCNNRKLT